MKDSIYFIDHNQVNVTTLKGCSFNINEQGVGIISIPIDLNDLFSKAFLNADIIKITNVLFGSITMISFVNHTVIINFYTQCYIN